MASLSLFHFTGKSGGSGREGSGHVPHILILGSLQRGGLPVLPRHAVDPSGGGAEQEGTLRHKAASPSISAWAGSPYQLLP